MPTGSAAARQAFEISSAGVVMKALLRGELEGRLDDKK